ncbi:MAG: hypothetical protein JJ913_13870 [Rhizobiaceae bacterium]|nr:hypothetical protein [Rhizobiaceae bacterium]
MTKQKANEPSDDLIRFLFRSFLLSGLVATIILVFLPQGTPAIAQDEACGTFNGARSWTETDWQSEVILAREKAPNFAALQGLAAIAVEGKPNLLVTHGGAANATMLDPWLKPLISKGLSTRNTDEGFPLLADVAVGEDGFMWTNYRAPEVIWTNRQVGKSAQIPLGDEFSGAVGIAYAPTIDSFLVPSRRSSKIAVIRRGESDWTVEIAELKLPAGIASPIAYDIQVDGDCATVVYREAGTVLRFSVNSLGAEGGTSTSVAFAETHFDRPQHAQWQNGRFYVVETDARRVRVLSPAEKHIWRLNLPDRIFRGLAVGPGGRLFLTGFSDEPPASENATGVFELSVPQDLMGRPVGGADQ